MSRDIWLEIVQMNWEIWADLKATSKQVLIALVVSHVSNVVKKVIWWEIVLTKTRDNNEAKFKLVINVVKLVILQEIAPIPNKNKITVSKKDNLTVATETVVGKSKSEKATILVKTISTGIRRAKKLLLTEI